MSLRGEDLLARARRLGEATRSDGGVLDHLAAPLRRPLDRAFYARIGRLDDLAALGRDVAAAAPPADGPKVLVCSLRMWTQHSAIEIVLAHALRLRGARVELLSCGGGQPVCEVGWGRRASPRPCDRCGHYTERLAHDAGYPHHRLTDGFPWGGRPARAPREPAAVGAPGISDVARAAEVSAAWLTKSSDPATAADGPAAIADFAVAGAGVERAAADVLDRVRPDILVLLNGLFASERILADVARDRGIEVVTHEMAPRHGTILFGRREPAPDMDTDALWAAARDEPLQADEERALDVMVHGREDGSAAHESYFARQTEDERQIRDALDIAPDAPIVAAFTNLAWDTAVLGKDLGFSSMFDWLAAAVGAMERRPDAVLVIRVHPAEVRWGTAQPVAPELLARIGGRLPENVRIVGPEQAISSYTLMTIAERVLTYTSTVGLESALRGTPVAVAGITHYRGRGFTDDVAGAEDLARLIAERPAGRLDDATRDLCRRYAYAFFFRLMIPFTPVETRGAEIVHLPAGAPDLAPGADPHLDFICERILRGGELVLPRELGQAAAGAAA